jgi:predicted ATP-grasp superfamily ATP-dependent carboligase
MDDLVKLWEKPAAEEKFMIAGWHQWADAGAVSSGLPQYLISYTSASKIGEIRSAPFYLFQIPGTQYFLRPEVKMEEGHRKELRLRKNEIYYSGDDRKGLFIFLGEEPHLNMERYAGAFFDVVQELGVKRVAAVGGVYAPVPYDKERQVSCSYSLRGMKDELAKYAVQFSDYEGGVSIATYFVDEAEQRKVEYLVFYPLVPAYPLAEVSTLLQGIGIETDFKAWYDLMRRFNHMFGLRLDLAELANQSAELTSSMETQIGELQGKAPQLKEYMEKVDKDFVETPFIPLDDVWERELGDLLDE